MNSRSSQTRAANACQRCRRRKIKCSGKQPCDNCTQRSTQCEFEPEGRKVLVPEKYLQELRRKVEHKSGYRAQRRNSNRATAIVDVSGHQPTIGEVDDKNGRDEEQYSPKSPESDEASGSMNMSQTCNSSTDDTTLPLYSPLTSEKSTYIKDSHGRPRYLGHSSTWSFSQWAMNLIRDRLDQPESPEVVNFDSSAYMLDLSSAQAALPPDISGLPTLDRALYLASTFKFHVGQTFSLFDENEFTKTLHDFYDSPVEVATRSRLWYVQFLLVIAFAKAFLQQGRIDSRPPGSLFFVRGMNSLPHNELLYSEPVLAIETLCMISLYLQSVEMRCSAYSYIGQALRIAISQGMHREMPEGCFGPELSQRWRNVWWTVYILDRRFSATMGSPPSIQDHDITSRLPPERTHVYSSAVLSMNVELSRVIARVLNTVYSSGGRLDSSFLNRTQSVLKSIQQLAIKIEEIPPSKIKSPLGGISRVEAGLRLSYHQCIVLAIRPLILCLLREELKLSTSNCPNQSRKLAGPIETLLQTCIESATKCLEILTDLQANDLLEYFLPFDLESAFSSGFVLTVATAIIPTLKRAHIRIRKYTISDTIHSILDEMIFHGSVPARHRKFELQQLQRMLDALFEVNRPGVISTLEIELLQNQSVTAQRDVRHEDSARGNGEVEVTEPEMGPQVDWFNQFMAQGSNAVFSAGVDQMQQDLSPGFYNAEIDVEDIDDWLWSSLAPESQS